MNKLFISLKVILYVFVSLVIFLFLSLISIKSTAKNFIKSDIVSSIYLIDDFQENTLTELVLEDDIYFTPTPGSYYIDNVKMSALYSTHSTYDVFFSDKDLLAGKWAKEKNELMITTAMLKGLSAMHYKYTKLSNDYSIPSYS